MAKQQLEPSFSQIKNKNLVYGSTVNRFLAERENVIVTIKRQF
jgi:hypothetical protein